MKRLAGSTRSTMLLRQFNALMQELLKGQLNRNSFRLWEAEILVDILTCDTPGPSMSNLLRRYQRTVQRQLTRGAQSPMRFSDYLESTSARHHRDRRNRAA